VINRRDDWLLLCQWSRYISGDKKGAEAIDALANKITLDTGSHINARRELRLEAGARAERTL
jgi:hypothetical protein